MDPALFAPPLLPHIPPSFRPYFRLPLFLFFRSSHTPFRVATARAPIRCSSIPSLPSSAMPSIYALLPSATCGVCFLPFGHFCTFAVGSSALSALMSGLAFSRNPLAIPQLTKDPSPDSDRPYCFPFSPLCLFFPPLPLVARMSFLQALPCGLLLSSSSCSPCSPTSAAIKLA